jgi:hypothetical protein
MKGVGSMAPEFSILAIYRLGNKFSGRRAANFTNLIDQGTKAGTHNLRRKFDVNAQLIVAPPDEKAWWSAKTLWKPETSKASLLGVGVLFAPLTHLQLSSWRIVASGSGSINQQKRTESL